MEDSLYFNEQHYAVRDMVRAFAREEVAPVAGRLDAAGEFPWANVKRMAELGLLGVPWSEDLGGAGLDLLSYMLVINEMAKVDASHAITISAHTTLGTSPIVNFGTREQQRRFVPPASLPALGSVSPNPPSTVPLARRGTKRRCCSRVPKLTIGDVPSVVCAEIVIACEASTFAISLMTRM